MASERREKETEAKEIGFFEATFGGSVGNTREPISSVSLAPLLRFVTAAYITIKRIILTVVEEIEHINLNPLAKELFLDDTAGGLHIDLTSAIEAERLHPILNIVGALRNRQSHIQIIIERDETLVTIGAQESAEIRDHVSTETTESLIGDSQSLQTIFSESPTNFPITEKSIDLHHTFV